MLTLRLRSKVGWLCALMCVAAAWIGATQAVPDAAARSRVFSVKECFSSYAWGRIPLRFGNRHFGYRHIEKRRGYTPATRRLIRRTLVGYTTYEPQGNTIVFRRYRRGVTEVVVVGFNAIPRAISRDQIVGIVTAYEVRGDQKRRGFLPPNGGDDTDEAICTG